MYVNRDYRNNLCSKDMEGFRVSVKETDLYISVDQGLDKESLAKRIEQAILSLRYDLEHYIAADPEFQTALYPHLLLPGAPAIARTMAQAANAAGVGPMAAVAGAFAEYIGQELSQLSRTVIVENGGDIYISSSVQRLVAVFAGNSPFSNRIAIEVPAEKTPFGICTSSGTVGPSLSFGTADAVVIMAGSPSLADAVASAAGNVVQSPHDVKKGIKIAQGVKDVQGAVIIKDDQLAAWGEFNLVPVKP